MRDRGLLSSFRAPMAANRKFVSLNAAGQLCSAVLSFDLLAINNIYLIPVDA